MPLDTKDRRILAALDMHARMPLTELARSVGLSRQVVEYRIKRLHEAGIIFGALAIFDSVVVGYSWYRIAFRLLYITSEKKKAFIEHLKQNKYLLWLGEVGGNWDLVMNFICKDNFQFNAIFEEIILKYGSCIRDYEILIYIDVHDYERSYLLDKTKERAEFYHPMKYNPLVHPDRLDRLIISELSRNAWLTNLEIGQKLGVSGNTIRNRINDLIKNKVLLGFRLFINPSALGYKSYMLFFEITHLNLQKEKELYAYLKTIPNITFVVKHIGRWRIGMEIETTNDFEFQEIFVSIRGRFSEIITNFESFPLFKDHSINYFPEGNLFIS